MSAMTERKLNAWTFIGRAMRLRCPECGEHPIFVPLPKVRSLYDCTWRWITIAIRM